MILSTENSILSLGGGSLLDIGIYPVIDALYFMGVPSEIIAKASFAETGSEESISIIFRYDDGRMATLYSSFRTDGGIGCDLLCENGNLFFSRVHVICRNGLTLLLMAKKIRNIHFYLMEWVTSSKQSKS